MSHMLNWLREVFIQGESVHETRPEFTAHEPPSITQFLSEEYEQYALQIAGPPIPFHPEIAIWAAWQLANACWRLVGDDPNPVPLDLQREPKTLAEHLSADLSLRFLAAVYRRANSRDPESNLTKELDAVFRRWPLTGVRLELEGLPTTTPDFQSHSGLQLLYAERLVANPRWGWMPPEGKAREWVVRIFAEQNRPLPTAPTSEETKRA